MYLKSSDPRFSPLKIWSVFTISKHIYEKTTLDPGLLIPGKPESESKSK